MCSITKVLIVLILALVVEAVGVVFLSKGLKQIGEVQTIGAREVSREQAKSKFSEPLPVGRTTKRAK